MCRVKSVLITTTSLDTARCCCHDVLARGISSCQEDVSLRPTSIVLEGAIND